jgi:hypothetical protein
MAHETFPESLYYSNEDPAVVQVLEHIFAQDVPLWGFLSARSLLN